MHPFGKSPNFLEHVANKMKTPIFIGADNGIYEGIPNSKVAFIKVVPKKIGGEIAFKPAGEICNTFAVCYSLAHLVSFFNPYTKIERNGIYYRENREMHSEYRKIMNVLCTASTVYPPPTITMSGTGTRNEMIINLIRKQILIGDHYTKLNAAVLDGFDLLSSRTLLDSGLFSHICCVESDASTYLRQLVTRHALSKKTQANITLLKGHLPPRKSIYWESYMSAVNLQMLKLDVIYLDLTRTMYKTKKEFDMLFEWVNHVDPQIFAMTVCIRDRGGLKFAKDMFVNRIAPALRLVLDDTFQIHQRNGSMLFFLARRIRNDNVIGPLVATPTEIIVKNMPRAGSRTIKGDGRSRRSKYVPPANLGSPSYNSRISKQRPLAKIRNTNRATRTTIASRTARMTRMTRAARASKTTKTAKTAKTTSMEARGRIWSWADGRWNTSTRVDVPKPTSCWAIN